MNEDLTIQHTTEDDGTHVVAAAGYLDTHTAPRLTEVLDGIIDAGGRHVVLDLSQLRFVDSSGLVVLVSTTNKLRQHAGDLRVAAPTEQVRRIFGITRMDNVFAIFDTRSAALGA